MRERLILALALMLLSGLTYFAAWLLFNDAGYIKKQVIYHLAFLPIHALVISLILEEMISYREKRSRRRRLNIFLGLFFRQMGLEVYVLMIGLMENYDELDDMITVQPGWNHRQFKAARDSLRRLKLRPKADANALRYLLDGLLKREENIMEMIRNPNLWEFEGLYRTLVALFHLIEEAHYRGEVDKMGEGVLRHMAEDVCAAAILLTGLWLEYLEFLKSQHPVLFGFQVGLHSSLQPMVLEPDWEKE